MLENPKEKLRAANGSVEIEMRAFEVKTIRIARK